MFSCLYKSPSRKTLSYLSLFGTLGPLTTVDMDCMIVLVILRCWELVPFSSLLASLVRCTRLSPQTECLIFHMLSQWTKNPPSALASCNIDINQLHQFLKILPLALCTVYVFSMQYVLPYTQFVLQDCVYCALNIGK